MNISDFLRTALLNHALGVVTYTPPTTVWAALYTSPPTSAGGGTEVTAGDYQRVSTTWSVAALGSTTNASAVRFPVSGVTQANWGNISSLGLFDAPTGGHLLFYGPLSAVVSLALGSDFNVAASDLTIALQ